MSSITPVSGSGTTIPSTGSTSSTGLTSGILGVSDNQSTYSSEIAGGNEMTIIGFSSAVISATNNANETQWAIQQSNATQRNAMYAAFIQNSLDLIKTFQAFLAIASKYSNDFSTNDSAVNTLNSKLITYNGTSSADQAAVNTVNAAILGYNAGTVTPAQLQTAITTYNTYAAGQNNLVTQTNSAITAFNTSSDTTNADVDIINNELAGAGVPPLGSQDAYNGGTPTNMPTLGPAPGTPAPPPFGTVTYTPNTLTPQTNTMSQSGAGDPATLASILFQPFVNLMTGQYAATAKAVAVQSNNLSSTAVPKSGGKPPIAPNTTYQPTPTLNASTVTGGGGSGVSSAGLVMTLSNPLMSAVIDQNMFSANSIQIINDINALGSQLLTQIGLQSGATTVGLLGSKLGTVDLTSPSANAASALALANEIASVVSSGAFTTGVQGILAQNGITSAALGVQLTAAAELGLLQFGLVQLGQATGIPDLASQVLSSTPSAASLVSAQVSASDILNDSIQRENLVQDVANQTNISQDILDQSLNASIVDGEINDQAFQASLAQNGVDANSASSADAILQSTLQSQILAQEVQQGQISTEQLNSTNLNSQIVKNQVQNQSDATARVNQQQLKNEQASQSLASGAVQSQDLNTATNNVVGVASAAPSVPAAPATQVASITANLTANANVQSKALGLNPTEAQAYANLQVSTVVGPNLPGTQTNLRDLSDSRLNTLINTQSDQITSQLQDTIDNSKSRAKNTQLSELGQDIRDPGKDLTYVAQMYKRPHASNFLKDVDISV